MTNQKLLEAAIAKSGMSAAGFAIEILTRDPRTVRRWLEGATAIPPVVLDFLRRYTAKEKA